MCFSPKISTPQMNIEKAPEPAPLTQEVTGVEFGGTSPEDDTEESGRKSLKVEKESKGVSTKTAIRKSFFGSGGSKR